MVGSTLTAFLMAFLPYRGINKKVSKTDIEFQCRCSTTRAAGGPTVHRDVMVHTYAESRNTKQTLVQTSRTIWSAPRVDTPRSTGYFFIATAQWTLLLLGIMATRKGGEVPVTLCLLGTLQSSFAGPDFWSQLQDLLDLICVQSSDG